MDQKPNLQVELKRLEVERDAMNLNLRRAELRILEVEDEKLRIYDNIEATKKEVANLDNAVKKLKETVDKQKQE